MCAKSLNKRRAQQLEHVLPTAIAWRRLLTYQQICLSHIENYPNFTNPFLHKTDIFPYIFLKSFSCKTAAALLLRYRRIRKTQLGSIKFLKTTVITGQNKKPTEYQLLRSRYLDLAQFLTDVTSQLLCLPLQGQMCCLSIYHFSRCR